MQPLVDAIDGAKNRVEIMIFRFDRTEVEDALLRAVQRGVFVHALIAFTNRGGARGLRNLEMRLLAKGVNVARTAEDLIRYHGKYLIIDRRELYVLSFNFTMLDIDHSRSFALATNDQPLVQEAVKLFEADTQRKEYQAANPDFVVSPANARELLSSFLREAKKQLLIYDLKVGDPAIIRILEDRAKHGVEIRIIGKVARGSKLVWRELGPMRLHTRAVVCDGARLFLGSQSLRTAELESRREVGLLVDDAKLAGQVSAVFEDDWSRSEEQQSAKSKSPVRKVAKRFAKAIAKSLPPLAPVLEDAVREVAGGKAALEIDPGILERAVKDAVKEAVEESVRDAVDNRGDPPI